MQKINKDAFGQKLYVNLGEDISTNTALTMTFEPKSGDKIDVTPTLETSNLYVQDIQFLANHYVSYTVTDGLFDDYVGRWRMKATATLPAKTVASDYVFFQVTA